MAESTSRREAAFLAFQEEFVKNGLLSFGIPPEGLLNLLRSFAAKPGEAPDAMRSRVYKRLWQILWFGNKVGADTHERSTYIFPETLKRVVREIIPGSVKQFHDPTGPRVYKVNIGDLAAAKWPATKKT